MANTVQATPGYNRRIGIFFDLDLNGRRRAYRWSPLQLRAFPMPLDEADWLIAEETADHLSCHPLKGPQG
jgi:hypothetical protein